MSEAGVAHEGEMAHRSGTVAPMVQENDSAKGPREGAGETETSLLKLLQQMRKEGVFVPSREFTEMVQEETRIMQMRNASEELFLSLTSSSAAAAAAVTISQKSRPPLLTQLIEQILEYCRLKLLEKELTEPEAAGTIDTLTEEEHEAQLAKLLRRCTETYGQLLLAHSDAKPPTAHREKVGSPREGSNQASRKSLLSDGDALGRSKKVLAHRDALAHSDCEIKAEDWSPRGREQKHPTPFYETAYALVARAVQQRMRAAAEGSRLAQEKGGLAQLAARVEEELGWLFRSHEFWRRSRGLRQRGGAQVDSGGGPDGVESAQLAARAEAKLGEIIKNVSKSTAKLHDKFAQLESRFRRQDEAKQAADQMEKTPTGGADNKEAVVDHCASQGKADEIIAGFWLRAGPKHSRAEQKLMHHVVSTRSPMINALLPSPHEQAQVVKKATRQAFSASSQRQMLTPREGQRAQLNGGHIVGSNGHDGQMSHQISEAVDTGAAPAFKNTWALGQERIGHNLRQAQQRPSVLDRLVASKVA